CKERLKKGSAVLVDGELQSRSWKTDDGNNRSIVEIKARRIQFLNKRGVTPDIGEDIDLNDNGVDVSETIESTVENSNKNNNSDDYRNDSFDKFLSSEESDLIK
ncbi:MAG: single-stranded DNA-binding protein, partial [Ignavibacteriaceae bacterium]